MTTEQEPIEKSSQALEKQPSPQVAPTPRRRGRPPGPRTQFLNFLKLQNGGKPSKVDPKKALDLLMKQVPKADVARIMGVSRHNLTIRRLSQLVMKPEDLALYEANRGKLLASTEARMIDSLNDPEAISKASLNNRAYAFQQVHTARRLEEGKSTGQVSYAVLVADERRILAQLAEIKQERQITTSSTQPIEIIENNGVGILSPQALDSNPVPSLPADPREGEGRGSGDPGVSRDIPDGSEKK